jgi:hypothetical protein
MGNQQVTNVHSQCISRFLRDYTRNIHLVSSTQYYPDLDDDIVQFSLVNYANYTIQQGVKEVISPSMTIKVAGHQ